MMMKILYALCMVLPAVCSAGWTIRLTDNSYVDRNTGSTDFLGYIRDNNAQIVQIYLDGMRNIDLEELSRIPLPVLSRLVLYGPQPHLNRQNMQHLNQMNAPQLEYLDLIYSDIGDEVMGYFQVANFPKLSRINIAGNTVDSEGVRHLVTPENAFHTISLSKNPLMDEGARSFSRGKFLCLQVLDLDSTQLGSKGVKWLTRASLNTLQRLNLSNNTMGSVGAFHLSKGKFPELGVLQVFHNHLTGTQILEHGAWMKMWGLSMYGNAPEDFPCIQAEWPSMKSIIASSTNESESKLAEKLLLLQKKFHNCQISFDD